MQFYVIYFIAQIPALILGTLSIGSCVPLICPDPFIAFIRPYFLALQDAPGLYYIFLAPAPESAISPRKLSSFTGEENFEVKIWVLYVAIATGELVLAGPLS